MTLDKESQKAHYRFCVNVVLNTNGEDPDYLGMRMNSAFAHAIGNGALTGDSGAEVDTQDMSTMLLTTEAAELTEEEAATWLSLQLESGSMLLEDVAKIMARYALMDPAQAREELAERMNNSSEGAKDTDVYATQQRGGYAR